MPHDEEQRGPLTGTAVVVVIHNPVTRGAIVDALMAAGAHVLECARAAQGMAFAQGGVHLIIVDPNLPDVDGVEFITQLRRHHRTADVPLLQVTAPVILPRDDRDDADIAARRIAYPVDTDELIAVAISLLDRAAPT